MSSGWYSLRHRGGLQRHRHKGSQHTAAHMALTQPFHPCTKRSNTKPPYGGMQDNQGKWECQAVMPATVLVLTTGHRLQQLQSHITLTLALLHMHTYLPPSSYQECMGMLSTTGDISWASIFLRPKVVRMGTNQESPARWSKHTSPKMCPDWASSGHFHGASDTILAYQVLASLPGDVGS